MRYLLDTSTISGLSRPRPSEALVARLQRHDGHYCFAALVISELRYGAQRHPDPTRRERLNAFVNQVATSAPVLPFDAKAAEWLGVERARIEAAGRVVDLADLVIAATAAANQLVVVTANVRHFEGLRVEVEDWTREGVGGR